MDDANTADNDAARGITIALRTFLPATKMANFSETMGFINII